MSKLAVFKCLYFLQLSLQSQPKTQRASADKLQRAADHHRHHQPAVTELFQPRFHHHLLHHSYHQHHLQLQHREGLGLVNEQEDLRESRASRAASLESSGHIWWTHCGINFIKKHKDS